MLTSKSMEQRAPLDVGTCYTTRDRGRLHIAFNEHYLCSVNCYNNFFTKFLAQCFEIAQEVECNGKVYIVNKESYKKRYTALIHGNVITSKQPNELMTNHLSRDKVEKLTNKMMYHLRNENFHAVKKYLGKGANVNVEFHIHSQTQVLGHNETSRHNRRIPNGVQVGRVTLFGYTVLNKAYLPLQETGLYNFAKNLHPRMSKVAWLGILNKDKGRDRIIKRGLWGFNPKAGELKLMGSLQDINDDSDR